MNKARGSVAAFVFALSALAPAAVEAQNLGSRFPDGWLLHGCGSFACHWVNMWIAGPEGRPDVVTISYFLRSMFSPGGFTMTLTPQDEDLTLHELNFFPDWTLPNAPIYSRYFETSGQFAAPTGWKPTWMRADDIYGEEGGTWLIDPQIGQQAVYLTVTPEPASLLLIGTGLVGMVGAAARRRRKKTGEAPLS